MTVPECTGPEGLRAIRATNSSMPLFGSNVSALNSTETTGAPLQGSMGVASRREDRCLAPTTSLRGAPVVKISERLIAAGLVLEVKAKGSIAHFKVAIFDARRWLDEFIVDPSQTNEMIAAREQRTSLSRGG